MADDPRSLARASLLVQDKQQICSASPAYCASGRSFPARGNGVLVSVCLASVSVTRHGLHKRYSPYRTRSAHYMWRQIIDCCSSTQGSQGDFSDLRPKEASGLGETCSRPEF